MYKIAICDDEKEYRNILMSSIVELNIVINPIQFYEYESGEHLLSSDLDFDLLFLDIQMPGKDGNEVSSIFRQHNKNCILIFCTHYQMPLRENFKVYPFRYIMKDIDNRELLDELPDILNEMMDKAKKSYVTVTRDGQLTRIPIQTIMYLMVEGRKTKVICYESSQTHGVVCREKLKDLYAELCRECFEYVHSSYLVNMRKISHVEGKEITMENGDKVYISRAKSKSFNEAFTKFLNRKFRR